MSSILVKVAPRRCGVGGVGTQRPKQMSLENSLPIETPRTARYTPSDDPEHDGRLWSALL